MGLLDGALDNDITRFGLGLLAASGPTNDPMKGAFGNRLMQAVGSYDDYKQQQMAKERAKQMAEFQQMQMANYASEIKQREAAAQKAAFLQDFIQKKLGGDGTSGAGMTQAPSDVGMGGAGGLTFAGVSAARGGGASPIPANANPGGLGNMSLDDVTMLKTLGGPDLLNNWKIAKEGFERKPGTFYEGVNGKREYVADPTKGYNADGTLNPNFVESQRTLALIPETIKDQLGFEDVADGKGGSVRMPRPAARAALSGGQQISLTQPPQSSGYAGGSASTAAAGQREILEQELRNPKLSAEDRAAIQRELSRLPNAPRMGVTISDAEKEKQKVLAVGEANRANDNIGKTSQFNDFGNQIGVARTLLQAGPTGSKVGALVDDAVGIFGFSPSSANIAKKLETVAGWMIQNIPKAPGAQSDAELRDYKLAAGLVGDKTVPVEQRIAALDTVEQLKNLWESRANGTAKTGANNPNLLSELPKTAAVGARAKDHTTGQIMRFDGLKWKPE